MPKKATKKPRARPDHFTTTIPRIRPCRRCGAWLAAGIAEGMHTEVDIVALALNQQLWAILRGIQLYKLTRVGLLHLDQSRIQDPEGARYPEHRCEIRWPIQPVPSLPAYIPPNSDIPPY